MARITLLITLTVTFLATLVLGDSDFHFDDGSLMPGVRRRKPQHERVLRTSPPLTHDTPIFFPGEGVGPSVPGSDGVSIDVPVAPDLDAAGALDLPFDNEEADLHVMKAINSISNISDFANLFNLDLPEPELFDDSSIGLRVGGDALEGEKFDMAVCKPELVTVALDLPKEAGTVFYPTCIRIEQCGGCCYGPLLTCRPTVTKAVKVKVLKVSSSSSNTRGRGRGGRARRRRQSQQTYIFPEVVRHTACDCGCKVREEDCNSDLHTYYEGECACICKNKDELAKCEGQNRTKYWDNDSCSCYCRKPLDCSTGEYFSQDTCSCERLTARSGIAFGPEVERPTRRRRKPVRVPLK